MMNPTVGAIFLFWLVCEVIIANYIVFVWYRTILKKSRPYFIVLISIALLAYVFAITFQVGLLKPYIFPVYSFDILKLNYQLVIDNYFILYVLFEGIITIFIASIYQVLRFYLNNDSPEERRVFTRRRHLKTIVYVTTLTVSFIGCHVAYHVVYVDIVVKGLLNRTHLYNQFHFYFYICAFLWVLIDSIAAFYAFRFYRLFRHNKGVINELR